MKHNFQLSKTRFSNDPTKMYWACNNCDSGVLIPKGHTTHEVNQFMEGKMPCMPPIDTPIDDVIDNRTTIIRKKSDAELLGEVTPGGIYTGRTKN